MSSPDEMDRKIPRVLIVDDEPDVVEYLAMLLQDEGYETVTAADGSEALESVRASVPDLVTLDVSMPKASGTRFYRELRKDPATRDVPVVIVTAVTGLGGDPHAYENFMDRQTLVPKPEAFFPKPIDREAFLEKIRELLRPAATATS